MTRLLCAVWPRARPSLMPHGYCFLWDPRIVWLHVISDGLITLAYYCIPPALAYLVRRRRDLPFSWIFVMFGLFIMSCGTTHLMEIWNVWHAGYLLSGMVKALTATVSVITAAMLVPLVPRLASVPKMITLVDENRKLERQIADSQRFDAPIRGPLRRRVTGGFVAAMCLTAVLSLSSWMGARRAQQDAYWIAHTHEVIETIQRLLRHVIEAETSARAFALTGDEQLLGHYAGARESVQQDTGKLRQLTADNAAQQRRLDALEPQVQAAVGFADSIIARHRRSKTDIGAEDALETERLMNAMRDTAHAMIDEETRLLAERERKLPSGQRTAGIVAVAGGVLGTGLWVLAWVVVRREMGISTRARSELAKLNAELEQRVEQRTAALRSEIAERKQAEARNLRLAAIVDSSSEAILSKDLNGTITTWNQGAERLCGYSEAEVIGKNVRLIIPEHRHEEESQILKEVAQGHQVKGYETTRLRKNGSEVYVSLTVSPVRDESGRVVGASSIAHDITERRTAEQALREQKYALDQHAVVAITDVQGTITYANDKFCAVSKYSREELLGQNHRIVKSGYHSREFFREMYRTIAKGEVWQGELCNRAKDGSIYWLDTTIVPLLGSNGKPRQYMAIRTVITERKQAEQRLAEQAEELSQQADELKRSQQALEEQTLLLRSVLDSMAEGLIVADEKGGFVVWNPAAERILGQGAGNVPPEEWSTHYRVFQADMMTPFPAEQLPLARAIRGETSTAEMFVRNPELDEGVWIEVSGGPLKDKRGTTCGGVISFRNITQRKANEAEIRRLNEELEERVVQRTAQLAEANKELEAFTYSVSHDLRAPLRHIAGFSGILLEEFADKMEPEAQRYLQRIQDGTQRMGRLVDDLLKLARVGRRELNLQATQLEPLVQEVIQELAPDVEGRAVEWKVGELPDVQADAGLLKQVFENLLANALKYTRPRSPAVIEVGQKSVNGQATIFVRDNGVGFSMKYADRLFGVFQRLHRQEEFEGTGVGLATVQRIIQKHGGKIWVEAEVDKGATFYLTLRTARQPQQAARAGAAL